MTVDNRFIIAESGDGTLVNVAGARVYDAAGNVWSLAASATSGLRVALNGSVDETTNNVVFLGYFRHRVFQENRTGQWFEWDGGWVTSADPRGGRRGSFVISGGQVMAPDGSIFRARGINLNTEQTSTVCNNVDGTPLLALFPGLNCVRIPFRSYNSPFTLATFANQMAALRIVIIIEDNTGTGQQPYTGDQLTTQLAWYSDMAHAFKDNPYVWFGSFNEAYPTETGNGDDVTTNHIQIYNTIRATGNNAPIHLCLIGGGANETLPGSDTKLTLTRFRYAALKNIIWDYHAFDYSFPVAGGYSNNVQTITTALQQNINRIQSIVSADGIMPVLIGSFGESTDGTSVDLGATALVNVVAKSGYGYLAWHWWTGGSANNLTDGMGSLTPYGQQVAGLMASR